MNNMENISSKEYAEAYFAEEEEMKMGTHPSQIIPRATEELSEKLKSYILKYQQICNYLNENV